MDATSLGMLTFKYCSLLMTSELAPCLADSAMNPGKTMTSHSEAMKRITAKMDLELSQATSSVYEIQPHPPRKMFPSILIMLVVSIWARPGMIPSSWRGVSNIDEH
jgi:hypothetical protein